MRISDWSSDVCSSDLHLFRIPDILIDDLAPADQRHHQAVIEPGRMPQGREHEDHVPIAHRHRTEGVRGRAVGRIEGVEDALGLTRRTRAEQDRSEEHTSELQSLMRISYAVFCLKKKNALRQ